MIRAAGEAAVLLIAKPEGHERGLLELDRELLLGSLVERGERFGETHDLERALAEVVRLLGIEKENPVRDFGLGDDERDDGLRAELPKCAEPVVAVRRLVLPFPRWHGDHRIEESVERIDRLGETSDVCLGEIALERRRLDAIERERGEKLPVSAQWIAIGGEHGAIVVADGAGERRDGDRRRLAR